MAENINPAPPGSATARGGPTTAQLKGDIDSGRSGDKVEGYDPGLSPLGTDDEAAGRSPSAERIALARKQETRKRWSSGSSKTSPAHHGSDWEVPAFIGFIGLVAVLIAGGIWAFA